LAQLEEAELLFRTGAPPDARYTFKHALVQDTAYETLLRSRRQILHRQIADALRGEFAAVAAAEPELVAHHLTQAGLDEPAIEWWGKAGDQALHRSAFKEAAAHLGKAIELADKLAASAGTALNAASASNRLRLQTSLGNALIWTKGYMALETSAAFARTRELASQVEDASERFSAYFGLWAGHLNRSEPAPLRETAELFLREATARPDCPETLIAHRSSGFTCWYFGDFAGAHDHFQKTIELYDPARHGDFANRFGQDPRAGTEIGDALTLWVLGRIDEALRLADRPSPTPSRQRMLRQWVMCAYSRRGWPFFGTAPRESRPTAGRWPILSLDTISQLFGPAPRYFFRAGQRGPAPPKSRESPRCDAVSPSFGSKVGIGSCPFSKRPWPKPKRVPARVMLGSGGWTMRSPN